MLSTFTVQTYELVNAHIQTPSTVLGNNRIYPSCVTAVHTEAPGTETRYPRWDENFKEAIQHDNKPSIMVTCLPRGNRASTIATGLAPWQHDQQYRNWSGTKETFYHSRRIPCRRSFTVQDHLCSILPYCKKRWYLSNNI